MKHTFIIALSIIFATACTENQDWTGLWGIRHSDNVDLSQMDKHYAANQERWDATFDFLRNNNLDSLSLGIHEIIGRDVYAIVSEYAPKDAENCRFEAHRKYIDLQYVISGEEKIGIIALDRLTEVEPYVESNDIAFYGTEDPGAEYEVANPDKYFIFFPSDAHRPSMKNTCDSTIVKKLVVKILY